MTRMILGIVGCFSVGTAVCGAPEPVLDTYTDLDSLPPPPQMTGAFWCLTPPSAAKAIEA